MTKSWALLLFPIALSAGPARYARIGDFDGTVEVQLQAADDWQAVRRNMPIRELSWLRTESRARLEVELDDGCILRLGADSQVELSDYTRLSTGQRITLISLDHGVAYFTGAAEGNDSTVLALPGAQVTIHQSARLRLEARDPWSLIAAGNGTARYSSPTAEFDIAEGQMVKLDPGHPAKFFLYREIPPLDTDRWVDERDKLLLSSSSGARVPGLLYGLADLDAGGTWIESPVLGTVWKPKVQPGWAPFRSGKWLWYDTLGYTWIADEPWGWLPYHYGRWSQLQGTGWVWAPADDTVFMPGEVYWLKNAKLAGWGPLAPGESWKPPDAPRLSQSANTTYAPYQAEAREIDPAGYTARPQDPPVAANFVQALPSPSFPAVRLDAFRPALRAGSTKPVPVAGSVAFQGSPDPAPSPEPAPVNTSYMNGPPAPAPVPDPQIEDNSAEFESVVPAYLGIIVVTPPGYKSSTSKNPPKPASPHGSGSTLPPPKPTRPKLPDPDKPVK